MWRWAAILSLVCAPSAYIAWHGRDIPQLGLLQDDALYLVSAKSIAAGLGYRILSLPSGPAQTKYPPGYPLLLSAVWRINPRFPENMPIAALLAWVMLPVLVATAWFAFRRMGLAPNHAGILCALMAISAPVVWFAVNLMPELAFTIVLLASTMQGDSDRKWWNAAAAGVLGGIAYLLKSAALPLLITSTLLYVVRRRYQSASIFCAGMLPFIFGWSYWGLIHEGSRRDSTWIFYTNYFAYQALNVPLRDYPLVVWVNLKTLWFSLGELIVTPEFGGVLGRFPACAAAVITLAGVVILVRRRGVTHYQAFAVGLLPILLLWHYPPGPRFVLPLMPLLLAGLSVAVLEAWHVLRDRKPGARRVIALATLMVLAALAPYACVAIYGGPLVDIFGAARRGRQERTAVLPEYEWIKANAPEDAAFVATDDAVLYLYTGRSAMALHLPPKLLYHKDLSGMAREYRGIYAFAASNHLTYLLHTDSDFKHDFFPTMGRDIVSGVLADPRHFHLVHCTPGGAVYAIRGPTGDGDTH